MKLDGADAPTLVHVDSVPLVGTPGHVHEASGGVNVKVGSNVPLGGLKTTGTTTSSVRPQTLPPSQQTWVTELHGVHRVGRDVGPDGAPRIPRVITEPTDPPAFLVEKPQAGIVPDFAIRTHCVWRRQHVPELSNGAEGYIYAAMFDRVEGGRRMTSGICSYRKSCAADGGQQIEASMEAIMAIMQNNSKPDKDGTPPM